MSSTEHTQGILIDLDSLLDTRLGLLESLNPGITSTILEQPYHDRVDDSFPFANLDKLSFKKLYRERDEDVLVHSKMTNIMLLLNNMVVEYLSRIGTNPYFTSLRLYVNLYPYQLEEDEIDYILRALVYHLNDKVDIETIFMEPKQLTPSWLDSHVSTVIMYDVHKWLAEQANNFNAKRLPELIVFGPALYQEHTPTEEELKDAMEEVQRFNKNITTPFESIELAASVWISLNLIDVRHFSITDPKTTLASDFMAKIIYHKHQQEKRREQENTTS